MTTDKKMCADAPHPNRETREKFDDLRASFTGGKITRRNFISGAVALGVSMTAAAAVVSRAEAATPKRGGRLRTALTGGATSDVLDPGQSLDTYMNSLSFGQLRNCLTEVDVDGALIPELAESWDASADASKWTLKIRSGVEFHNGKTLTAQDVIDTLKHHTHPDSTSAAKSLLASIESIKADGKNTVVVQLNAGSADFPFLLSDYHLGVCPSNGDGTIDWQSGVGTGGYALAEHEPGVRSLTKRHPNYWKRGRAHFDENETLHIADTTARTSALLTNAIDCMNNVDVKTVNRLKRLGSIKVLSTTGNKQATLPMRTDTAPFDDNNVRLALKHIVDREQWLNKIRYGYGELGNDNPIGPANYYRATEDELPQRQYDPEKAKHYLRKAGLSKLSVQFSAAETGFTGAVDAAQLMKESARDAGIKIDIIREPDDGYWSNVWLVKPWSACYWSGRPTEDWMFTQVYAADAEWNDTYWKHPRFNKLLVEARAELNSRKRREMYVEMQRIIHNDGGVLLPMFLSDVLAHNSKVATPNDIGGNWELDGLKQVERWWFA